MDVPLKEHCAFANDAEVADVIHNDPRAAIEAAKRMASDITTVRVTARSSIVIGGEGRATRELELQWWPNLFQSQYGKLTIRFFVEKVIY